MKSFLAAAVVLASLPAFAGDVNWPRFRGPAGSGVADSRSRRWNSDRTKTCCGKSQRRRGRRRRACGATPFPHGIRWRKLWTLCLDRATGKELWRRDAGAEKIEAFLAGQGSPAASTPATDGERVIVYFGSCGLIAYDSLARSCGVTRSHAPRRTTTSAAAPRRSSPTAWSSSSAI